MKFIDIHALQTLPPHNINRGESGAPKTAIFGGLDRARVSSQSWKRATRLHFNETYSAEDLAVRTKRIVRAVAEFMKTQRPELNDEEAVAAADVAVQAAGFKTEAPKKPSGKDDDEQTVDPAPLTKYLIFMSRSQIRRLGEVALEVLDSGSAPGKEAKAKAKAAAKQETSIDVALFGRMVADAADLNVDAACQVAHAISVHGIDREFDYYTAVDDMNQDDESGAGMLGTVEFNSATLYRYANVDVTSLLEELGDAQSTGRAAAAFVESFITSLPTGKQTTFAAQTLPEAVLIVVREKRPVSLVQAFESGCVATPDKSRLQVASEALVRQLKETKQAYGDDVVAAFVVRVGDATAALDTVAARSSLDETTAQLEQLVARSMGGDHDE